MCALVGVAELPWLFVCSRLMIAVCVGNNVRELLDVGAGVIGEVDSRGAVCV